MTHYTYDQSGRAYQLKGASTLALTADSAHFSSTSPWTMATPSTIMLASATATTIAVTTISPGHTTPTTRRSCHPTRTSSEDMCQKRSKR